MLLHRTLTLLTIVPLAASLLASCGETEICSLEPREGPALVTVTCAPDARDTEEALGFQSLAVEYRHAEGTWKPCRDANDQPYPPAIWQVCDEARVLDYRFACGDSAGTFEIRAKQGTRSAGPVEITTRMKNQCDYDPKTLHHELFLDVTE